MRRTTLYKTAVIVHFLASLFGALSAFPRFWAAPEKPGITRASRRSSSSGALMGVMGIVVSAYGAWHHAAAKWDLADHRAGRCQWAAGFAGGAVAPNNVARLSAILGVAAAVFVIVGMLLWSAPPAMPRATADGGA
ncbi:MAG: hypothetical protein R2851_20825 [Caldilineaceae bacterium]